MKNNKSSFFLLLTVLLIALYFLRDKNTEAQILTEETTSELSIEKNYSIDELTKADVVVAYLKEHGKLPEYYITKSEARDLGWIASKGNLCELLPGKAIGGDYFGNREGKLPTQKARKYYEADLNYDCGRRNADRVVYSNDGLIFLTFDHYKSFEKQ